MHDVPDSRPDALSGPNSDRIKRRKKKIRGWKKKAAAEVEHKRQMAKDESARQRREIDHKLRTGEIDPKFDFPRYD